jgi:D-amino-acid dehydrogenase
MRPLTPDGLPMLGRAPGQKNLYIATGHAMLGVTLAPATGEAMAQLITDPKAETVYAPFAPGRFNW